MTDAELIARLQEFRSNQMADPRTAPEFVFLDPDLPVSEWEKQYSMDVIYVRADRIEALIAENKRLEARLGEYNLLWQAYDGDLHRAYVDANEARIDAEAKLEMAVKAFEEIKRYSPCGDSRRKAVDTLAELKAYDHD